MYTALRFARSVTTGCSARQVTHQLPQKFTRYGLPSSDSLDMRWSGLASTGRSNSGTGLLINGEGIWVFLSDICNPTTSRTTNMMNATNGSMRLLMQSPLYCPAELVCCCESYAGNVCWLRQAFRR